MSDQIPARALAFLSSPYSKFEDGLDAAHADACRIAGLLMRAGIHVFSPIAHCHWISIYGAIDPLDHQIWIPRNALILERCDVLIVAHLRGWRESIGVRFEIDEFNKMGKPIFDLHDPHDPSRMTKRKPVRPPRERYEGTAEDELRRDTNEYLGG